MGRRCGGDVHRPRSHRGPAHGDAGARHHRDHRHGYRGADQDRDPRGRHGGGPGDRAEIHPGGEAHREGDETPMKGSPGTGAPEHRYAVVTADLVMSRGLADRRGTPRRLVQLVDTLNTEFGKDLAAPFMITLGDEIQGLLREPWISSRSEEHTSELQSPDHLVCRLLLEKKK